MAEGKKGCRKGCMITVALGGILFIGLFAFFAVLGSRNYDARVACADAFVDQIRKGDLKAAYALTSEEFRRAVTQQQMEARLQEKKLSGDVRVTWEQADRGDEGHAAIRGKITLTGGGTTLVRVTFVEEGDGYRIRDVTDPLPEKPAAKTLDDEDEVGFSWSWSTATLKDVRLTASEADDAETLLEFPQDIERIYCCGKIAYAPSGTKVTARWYRLSEDGKDETLLIEKAIHTEQNTRTLWFNIVRTEEAFWPTGKYRVRLFVGKKEQKSLDFVIREPTLQELTAKAQSGNAEAAFGIYAMHVMGKAEDLREAEAIQWLRKAADAGHAIAQFNLGILYGKGQGVPKDPKVAFDLYHKSAEQGHATAEYNLGVCYREGTGVEKNLTEAIVWTRKAAEHGDADAQYNMGVHYNIGQGVAKDRAEAEEWFRKAAAQGHAGSKKALEGEALE